MARDFSSDSVLKAAGILCVFQSFYKRKLEEKIRQPAADDFYGVSLNFKGELVVQAALVTQLDELLLDGLANGHTQRLTLNPCQVFLLTGGVDTLSTGSLGGVTQSTQNVTGSALEGIQTCEELGVDDDEEVTQTIEVILAGCVLAGQCLLI